MRYAIIDNTIVQEVVHFTSNEAEVWIIEHPDLLLKECGVEVLPNFTYNENINTFISPKPFPSWGLNAMLVWEAPKPYPIDGNLYCWLEDILEWKKVGS
jgi:hypothetical protein